MLLPEFFGYFLTMVVLIITNCGGNGGGGALIPVLYVFFQFDARNCIALSNATILVSSCIRYVVNFKAAHPLKEGTGVLIDYNVATMMLPMIIVGAALGVMVNEILHELVMNIIYTVVLALIFITILHKFIKARQAETAKFKAAAKAIEKP